MSNAYSMIRSESYKILSFSCFDEGLFCLLIWENVVGAIEDILGGVNLSGIIKLLGYADDTDIIGEAREKVSRMCGGFAGDRLESRAQSQ